MQEKFKEIRDYFDKFGEITGYNLEWLIETIEEQQKEIEQLKADKQVLSHYKFMYEQAKY